MGFQGCIICLWEYRELWRAHAGIKTVRRWCEAQSDWGVEMAAYGSLRIPARIIGTCGSVIDQHNGFWGHTEWRYALVKEYELPLLRLLRLAHARAAVDFHSTLHEYRTFYRMHA